MKTRKLHRVIGLVMLLPLFGWAITGFIFFLKPGYEGAYELLQLKTYSVDGGEYSLEDRPVMVGVQMLEDHFG